MVFINSATQLSLFDTFVSIVMDDSVLGKVFNKSNIHNFSQFTKRKGVSYPYLVFNVPDKDLIEFNDLKRNSEEDEFTVGIELNIDYVARDKYTQYANALINALNNAQSTFDEMGYYDSYTSLIDTDVQVVEQKQIVTGEIEFVCTGDVVRR